MIIEYFLGRATGEGFRTTIHNLIEGKGYFTYIIKGGPGTGKSSMMRKIAQRMTDGEVFRCSSDPHSLDGVVMHDKKIILVDGTSPHVVEPTYSGACQRIINLGECWDAKMLRDNSEEIVAVTKENAGHHRRVKRCLKAIEALSGDILTLEEECILKEKTDGFISREAARLPKCDKKGVIEFRQMSAITPEGYLRLDGDRSFERVMIEDSGFGVRDYILKGIARDAAAKGHRCLISESPLHEGCVYDQLMIPDLKLWYVSSGECSRKIRAERFLDKDKLRMRKARMAFDRGTMEQLIQEAVNGLAVAKESHDRLEAHYIKAMNFDKVAEVFCELEKEIFG